MKGCKDVKNIIKLILCFLVVITIIMMFYQKSADHSAYLKKIEESALIKATEKYGEGCTVLGRRYNSSNKSCNVGVMNKDKTLVIVYEVKYYSHNNGEETFFARETVVSTDVDRMKN